MRQKQELRLINIPVVFGCRAPSNPSRDLDLFDRFGIIVPFLWKAGKFIRIRRMISSSIT